MEMGVKHFCMGWDVGVLHAYWRNSGEALAALLAGKPVDVKVAPERPAGNYR